MTLFVLGAGFSRSFVETAPLQRGFLGAHVNLLKRDEYQIVNAFMTAKDFSANNANIEDMLEHAETDKEWNSVVPVLKNLIRRVLDESFPFERGDENGVYHIKMDSCRRRVIERFAEDLLLGKSRAHVLSLNYDVLLENTLQVVQSRLRRLQPVTRCFHSGRSYGFHAWKWKKSGVGIEPQKGPRTPCEMLFVLKLHGSMNWEVCSAEGTSGPQTVIISAHERNLQELPQFKPQHKWIRDNKKELPLIVPPIRDKTQNLRNPVLKEVWQRAETMIRNARRLVFCGYSFPDADKHVRSTFATHFQRSACSVDVVNNDDSEDLQKRYRDVFGNGITFHCGDAWKQLHKFLERDVGD